jgi:choline dehydrogenase-like flavoprotein
VILLEAGGDAPALSGGDPSQPGVDRLPGDYDVPAFHAFASENDAMRWDFFVRRRPEPAPTEYYPRAGTLGGCTAHNAMIFVAPQRADWESIADLTGDDSWRADRMWKYFRMVERCRHRPLLRFLAAIGIDPTRHGWGGWLQTECPLPMDALGDRALRRAIVDEAINAVIEDHHGLPEFAWALKSALDPNDGRLVDNHVAGVRLLPMSTRNGARNGARERVLEVAARHPDRLKIVLNALATRVRFDDHQRAVGVEYLDGANLYRAGPSAGGAGRGADGRPMFAEASAEVILAGGTFNTPQLLMLSGVGPRADLERVGIPVRVANDRVGRNLQDRYEVSVVNRMPFAHWPLYKGATFAKGDPQFAEWQDGGDGVYSTNGAVLSIFRKSPGSPVPDVFCMGLLTNFSGYRQGYSAVIPRDLNCLSWVVLKAHTRNRSGVVSLRSADPRDTPAIDFKFFADGGDEDVAAVVEGVRFVRRLTERLGAHRLAATEMVPGTGVQSDADLTAFVRAHAWGHHPTGTCAIGPPGSGVVDSAFRVQGTTGLRVVDASIFPRIPGFFIVSAVYMIGEKAADVILGT